MNTAHGLKGFSIMVIQIWVFAVFLGFSRKGKPSRGSNQWLWINEKSTGINERGLLKIIQICNG